MECFVFTGPTLARGEARRALDAVYLPPAQQGDVYRVALRQPRAIGVIDGYFEGAPALRHKEILWTLDQGIHVFGSASMGALRATELAQFGMVGIGRIFADYRDGILADDDEVAVVHGQRGAGYAAATEALANVRYTLARAAAERVIEPNTCEALIQEGKNLFYKKRDLDYRWLSSIGAERQFPQNDLNKLLDWLRGNRINQKRDDALAMLRALADLLASNPQPCKAGFRFEHTTIWESAMTPVVPVTTDAREDGAWLLLDHLLDEIRLQDKHGVDEAREAQLRALAAQANPLVDAHLADYLHRVAGLSQLVQRAYDKETHLLEHGILRPEPDDTALSGAELAHWYFEQRRRPLPDDLGHYATALRFADTETFVRALAGEYLYVHGTLSSTL
jgi:hypothetical protein